MTPIHREWTIGNNALRFEPPDLLWAEFRGALSLEGATRLVALYRELGESRPFFMVAEMQAAEPLDPETGRYISEHVRTEWIQGIVYIGARLVHKALARGIVLASQLTEMADVNVLAKIHFVSTREQAHALLAQLRAR
ncbi:hypothetical protein JRI60_43420 [Archangium violaceum]|uniref:hypothetical protein n=1 Tax=Archangium violaceum TaxID=83451 RepID=UPI001951105B|nr:hypothetical protein [Archangium violaceum]QRN95827.1 hypothetical protein JRI60_43420 [Archangium violaceum]